MKKPTTIIVLLVIVIAVGAFFFYRDAEQDVNNGEEVTIENAQDGSEDLNNPDADRDENDDRNSEAEQEKESIIGTSVEGNQINAYHFGTGDDEILLVGGLHGGYSWNTSLLMFEVIDYLEDNSEIIPENIKITVIPVMNPDGLDEAVGTTGVFNTSDVATSNDVLTSARFNANDVDLNRNFDCEWQSEGTWRSRAVSGGDAPFSEPESKALRSYVERAEPVGAVVWYSAAGGVYASSCRNGVLPQTTDITQEFADASGYPAFKDFDFYEVTGDAVNWLAKESIPAISVLLTNHQDTEFNKNIKGIEAVLDYYAR